MPDKDRVNALISGNKIDRVPFCPFILGFCAKNVGFPLASIYNDPEKSFLAQIWTREQYGYDSDPFYGYASYGGWEFGGEINFPEGEYEQAPTLEAPPVSSENDVYRLNLPDVKTAGMLPLAMHFSQMQSQSGMPASVVLSGPFTVAGNICGAELLSRWLIRKAEVAHQLLRLATDHLLDVVEHWVETFGAERLVVQVWEPLASNHIISPKQFETFVLPYQTELHRKILSLGVRHILCHICGEQNLNLPYWAQVPMGSPGIVSFGSQVDISVAIRYFGETCVIAGNVEPAIIQTGTPDQVYEQTKMCINKGKHAPRGYMLMAGCEVPVMTPPYNLHIMQKAISDYGRYD